MNRVQLSLSAPDDEEVQDLKVLEFLCHYGVEEEGEQRLLKKVEEERDQEYELEKQKGEK